MIKRCDVLNNLGQNNIQITCNYWLFIKKTTITKTKLTTMKTMQEWLDAYGVSHQNGTNKLIHWICVPTIMFSLIGLLYTIPPLWATRSLFINWGTLMVLLTLLFYIRLSFNIFVGFIFVGGLMVYLNHQLAGAMGISGLVFFSIALFVIAWIGQFIGHKIEGQKPSFLEDLQFLLIGPAWLMHFVLKKIGIKY